VNATQHRLVDDYLSSLDEAAKRLPRRDRDELVDQIRTHLDEAISEHSTEAEVRNILDALGDPNDIVAAAGPERSPVRRGPREVFALFLLVTGFPPFIGWLVGLGLLIWSPLWTARQKWLGALVWPGGLLGLLFWAAVPVFSGAACVSGVPFDSSGGSRVVTTSCATTGHAMSLWYLPVLVLAFALPIAVGVYLWWAAGRRSDA